MKKVLILGLLAMLLFAGCSSYEKEDLWTCNEGKFSPNNEMKSYEDETGYEIDYILVKEVPNQYSDKRLCQASIILVEPITILGTDVKSLPGRTCNVDCIAADVEAGYEMAASAEVCCFG